MAAVPMDVASTSTSRSVGNWELQHCLGEGLQGEVYLALNRKTGASSALKFLFQDKMQEKQLQNLRREVAAMEAVKSSPNVVKMLSVDWAAKFPVKGAADRDVVVIELELCEGGELFNYLMFTGFFDEKLGRTYFRMLIDGLSHLHSKGFSHRDIKAENLLLQNCVLKIADFGFSSKHELAPGRLTKMRTMCGTPGYMAPELLSHNAYNGPPVDVWACGVLLFVMLVGSPPMAQAHASDWWFDRLVEGNHELFWRAHEQTGHVISDVAKDLIMKLLAPDPMTRLTLAEVKAHPWYTGAAYTIPEAMGQLQERKHVVDKKRDEERRKKEIERRHKERQRVSAAKFDPFAATVYRATSKVSGADAAAANAAAVAAGTALPQAPARLPLTHFQLPNYKPAQAWAIVQKAISGAVDSAVDTSSKTSGTFTQGYIAKAGGSTFSFNASLYARGIGKADQTFLSLTRQSGDLMAFNRMFTSLGSKLCGGEIKAPRPVGVLLPPSAAMLAATAKA